jgi:hypothetical protein
MHELLLTAAFILPGAVIGLLIWRCFKPYDVKDFDTTRFYEAWV